MSTHRSPWTDPDADPQLRAYQTLTPARYARRALQVDLCMAFDRRPCLGDGCDERRCPRHQRTTEVVDRYLRMRDAAERAAADAEPCPECRGSGKVTVVGHLHAYDTTPAAFDDPHAERCPTCTPRPPRIPSLGEAVHAGPTSSSLFARKESA